MLLYLVFILICCQCICYQVVEEQTHDPSCFTQGLQLHQNGFIYESCGLFRKSNIRKIDPVSYKIIQRYNFPRDIFAEGLTIIDNYILVLTWQNNKIYVLDLEDFKLISVKSHDTEGWGIAYDHNSTIIASDGSDKLYFYSKPQNNEHKSDKSLQLIKTMFIKDSKTLKPISRLNELEYVDGFIYANIWLKDIIYKIDIQTGIAIKIDFSDLYPINKRYRSEDCLNGIAYNQTDQTFLLTGKQWKKSFIITFDENLVSNSSIQRELL